MFSGISPVLWCCFWLCWTIVASHLLHTCAPAGIWYTGLQDCSMML
jgi:hypothetical protein